MNQWAVGVWVLAVSGYATLTGHAMTKAFGSIPGEMGGKSIAGAVFIDFGIPDAIADPHRRCPPSFAIPPTKPGAPAPGSDAAKKNGGDPGG